MRADPNLVVSLLRTSAEKGNSYAEFLLGCAYLAGDRVAQDRAEGLKWLERSAAQNNKDALKFCERGIFVERDPERAKDLELRATRASAGFDLDFDEDMQDWKRRAQAAQRSAPAH